MLRAKPLERLPAYAALIERIGAQSGNALAWAGALIPRYRPVLADGQPLWREP